jgi:hypothetical protein
MEQARHPFAGLAATTTGGEMAIVDRMGEHAARALGRTRKDLRVLAARRRLAKARGVLSVDFDGEGIGFFAQMNGLLRLGRYAMEHDLVPDIRFLSSNYKDLARGADWLSYYFDRRLSFPELRSRKPIYIRDLSEFPVNYDTDLSLHEANALIFRFYRLRPEIEQAVAEFSSANGVGENTLGIHYRGTDKSSEAPRVSEQRVVDNALAYLRANRSVDSVFLASDEAAFINYARSALNNYRISCLPDSIRSLDGRPIHLSSSGAGYLVGRDALLNALVLARCRALLRTSSFLSAWSSIFRPSVDVFLLNKPFNKYLWYPEREILKTATVLD